MIEKELTELVLAPSTMAVTGGIYFFLRAVGRTPVGHHALYKRALPILPDALGVLVAVLGAVPVVAEEPILIRVAMGLWCGYVAQRFHKILGQLALGDDPDIARAQVPLAPAVELSERITERSMPAVPRRENGREH